MLYQDKETKDIVELLFSDNTMCVYVKSVPVTDVGVGETIGQGVIFKGTKKEFKKEFKKAPKKVYDKYDELDEAAKDEVFAITLGDRYGLLNHTQEYIKSNLKLQDKEWAEFHENISDEDREKMLEELKD